MKGEHVHCDLFVKNSSTFINCGHFVVRQGEEFTSLLRAFNGAEFIPTSGDAADKEPA